jgi:hypothetical protein
VPKHIRHRYCSQACWGTIAADVYRGIPHPEARKVERPTHEQLLADVASMSFVAVGRKYGVSDNAVRKWLKWHERQAERARNGGHDDDQVGRESGHDRENIDSEADGGDDDIEPEAA